MPEVWPQFLAAGVDSATIDTVLLTHMHPDHSAGLTHMPSGTRNFPNADFFMHMKELRHWFDDAAMSKGQEQTQSLNFRAGREQVAPYAKQTRLFEKGEVFPGVTGLKFLAIRRVTRRIWWHPGQINC